MNILICVTGSISAYKVMDVAKGLKSEGHEITLVFTDNSKKFVEPRAFSFQHFKVYIDVDEWTNTDTVLHIDLMKWADVIALVPATANTIAKVANGLADNLVTCIFRACYGNQKKIVIAPAMNTNMYLHPITEIQLDSIRDNYYKATIINPVSKELACGDTGVGALAPTHEIVRLICGLEEGHEST